MYPLTLCTLVWTLVVCGEAVLCDEDENVESATASPFSSN